MENAEPRLLEYGNHDNTGSFYINQTVNVMTTKENSKNSILKIVLLLLSYGAMFMPGNKSELFAQESIRKAAVAGQFYPADPENLKSEVEKYLSGEKSVPGIPRLMISPHAGYVFSGPVAGKGYASLNKNVKTVIIIGPSHYQYFEGIYLPEFSYYETPLGKVEIASDLVDKLRKSGLVVETDGADEPEHCIEVQLPFLQVKLDKFRMVPILIGKTDPRGVAEILFPIIDNSTIVIASSDLSHYHSQAEAEKIDAKTIETITEDNPDGFLDACGERAIRVVMRLAEKLNLKPVKIYSATSYDTAPQYGLKSKVVGYASIIYPDLSEIKKPEEHPEIKKNFVELSPEIKKFLLHLARQSLTAAVKGENLTDPKDVPLMVKENRGCFVTLTENGTLRGCIGYIEPVKPLYTAVIENARNAALNDPRFSSVRISELGKIKVEVSVLSKPVPLKYSNADDLINKLRPGIDGVILQNGYLQSTFLPQVWEQLPDKVLFLEHLSLKGGMPSDGWKTANVKIYHAEHFQE